MHLGVLTVQSEEDSERGGGAHMGFSERTDTILNRTVYYRALSQWKRQLVDLFLMYLCGCVDRVQPEEDVAESQWHHP